MSTYPFLHRNKNIKKKKKQYKFNYIYMQRASLVSYLGLDAITYTPSQLLTLYKAQFHPCLEYGSHLWRGASKHSLVTLDAIQKRAIKLIGDPALTNSLDSLDH